MNRESIVEYIEPRVDEIVKYWSKELADHLGFKSVADMDREVERKLKEVNDARENLGIPRLDRKRERES